MQSIFAKPFKNIRFGIIFIFIYFKSEVNAADLRPPDADSILRDATADKSYHLFLRH